MSISSGDKLHVHPPLHPHEKEKVPLFSSSSLLEEKESYHNEKKEGASSIIVQNWREEEDRINAGSHSKEQDIHQRLQPEQSNAGQNKEDSVPSSAPTSSSTSNFKSQNNSPAVTRIPYPSSLSSLSPSKSHASLLSSENKKANEKESLKNDERVDQRNINDQTSSQSGHSPHNANHPPQTSPQQNKQNPNPKSSGRKPVSAASIVVCGVDGTVYTIDAYTGQLRGLFASGPALVHSSSSADVGKENDDDEAAGKNTGGNNNNEQSADDVENGWEDHSSDNSNNNRNTYDNSKSNALLSNNPGWKERVVPGLDGTLYSLFEVFDGDEMNDGDNYDNMDECQNFDSEEDGYFDDFCHSSSSSNDENGSGDTSSSTIMPRFGTYNLTPLPISVMDVVDSPISTCRPINAIDPVTHEPQQQCGIVVGSKKTTIYAIDPITGKVQWTQDPHGGAGAKGWTRTRSNPKTSSKTRMVLLQREDYAVRHLDTDGGEELWKVELGKFSALDFDVDAHHRRNSDESEKNDFMNGEEDGRGHHNINKRRRGAAAAAASLDNKDKKRGVSPLLGPKRTHSSLRDNDSFFGDTGFFGDDFEQQHDDDRKESLFDEDDIVHDHSQFLGLPSIAFGEDGISIMAVDGMSGEILWKRRIESVVAAVYGVGKESIWIPLDVIDESEIFSHDHHSSSQSNGQQIALLPSSSQSQSALPSNGGLVPYLNGQHKSGQLHRLGRHHTNLFVSSKFDDVSLDSSSWSKPDMDRHDFPYVDELLNLPLRPQINDHGHGFSPSPASTFDIHSPDGPLPPSHASEHGLFLNWQMLYAIIAALLATIIFAGFAYFRQKRKWENTPLLAPASATNSSEDGVGRLRANSNGIILPPAFSTSGDPWWKEAMSVDKLNKPQPYFRSLSLSAIGSPPGAIFSRPFVSEKDGTTLPLHEMSADAAPTKLQIVTTGNTSPVPSIRANASSPATLSRSKTLPIDSPTCDKAKTQPPLNIDNIDGIPLIRYSRYRSEFTELSPLGKGGFGTVFRCVNTLDSREYAIKKIWIKSQLRLDDFSQKLHRVLREVKILAVLDHPNIVRYYTAWCVENSLMIAS